MHRYVKVLTVVVIALSGVVAAGCGSSDDSGTSSSSSASTGASTTSGSSAKKPILFGAATNESGIQSTYAPGFLRGLKVWVDSVNASGGIQGHKVEVPTADGKSTPTGGVTAISKLIEGDNATALATSLSPQPFDEFSKAQIAVIGGPGADTKAYLHPEIFPVELTSDFDIVALGQATAKAGKKIAIMYCAEIVGCQQANAPAQKVIEAAGSQVVSTTSISLNAPKVRKDRGKGN